MTLWADKLDPQLSQGDVVANVMFFMATTASFPQCLTKKAGKGGSPYWEVCEEEAGPDGTFSVLARARRLDALVISHSCNLDKGTDRKLVLVAPISRVEHLSAPDRATIMADRNYARIALSSVPERGDCFADLRLITPIDRRLIDQCQRLASMSPVGERRLQARVVGYLARIKKEELDAFLDARAQGARPADGQQLADAVAPAAPAPLVVTPAPMAGDADDGNGAPDKN